jgi:REP element-mobilizing transposase RayT
MNNHYHLCIGTPLGNLSTGMRWLQATFAMRFNKYRKEQGHLFQGRFKSLMVEPGDYWLALVDYIHLKPVRAGLVETQSLVKYTWTGLFYFPKRASRPTFLKCEWTDYCEVLTIA